MSAARKKTLEEVLTEHVIAFSASSRPGEIITASVERLFTDAIKEAFSPHSSFGAQVKQEIAKALPANIASVIELPRYNSLIANALKERWNMAGATDDMLRRAEQAIEEVLRDDFIPEFVSLRVLLDSFVEVHQEKAAEKGWHLPHITLIEGGSARARTIHVLFDAEPENSYRERNSLRERTRSELDYSNRVSVRITGHSDRGFETGEVYGAMLEGQPIGRNFSMTSKWQKLVAALYFGASKLIIDCREDEFSYGTE